MGSPLLRFSRFGANLAPTWRAQRLQNRGRNPEKSMLKNKTFSASIFDGFGPRFGRVFGRLFAPKMHGNNKNTISAKTLKLVLPSRRNWYFQGFEALICERCCRKRSQKTSVFWNDDLEGFGEAKWKRRSTFGRFCCDVFFDCVLASILDQFLIDFGRFLGGQNAPKTFSETGQDEPF